MIENVTPALRHYLSPCTRQIPPIRDLNAVNCDMCGSCLTTAN